MRNKVIGVTLGLLIAAALLLQQSAHQSGSPRLLSECDGAIKTVALQYTRDSGVYSAPCYRAFLSRLEPDVEVIVVCSDRADADDFDAKVRQPARLPHSIKMVFVGKPITGWCKDRFLVAAGSPAQLIQPRKAKAAFASRANDSLVAPALARSCPKEFRAVEIPMVFDAGDIVPTSSRVIVSDNLWRKNNRPDDFRSKLRRLFGDGVIWLRGAPDHHIGMYAAPLDDRTVVVGDPALGRRLWTKPMESRLGVADFSRPTVAPFERAADELRAAGFRVIRAPLVPMGPQTYVTYTNAVFEKRAGRNIVYMPVYGERALDAAGRRVYESAGWEVRPIPVRTVFRFRGTIGCLINVLERR